MTETYVYDRYAAPSKEHWLGTDTNGMDMLTRLMYGGRVSLIIGFIVVVIEASLGILMGGISGYFGGWIDNIIYAYRRCFLLHPPRCPSSSSSVRPWTRCASIPGSA